MQSKDPVPQATSQSASAEDHRSPIILQVPAFMGDPVELTFIFTNTPPAEFIHVLATATDERLTEYSQETEYWATGTAPSSFAGPMSMGFAHGMYTNAQASSYLSGYGVAFTVGQQSSSTAWIADSSTPYTPPTGTTAYLYSAPDPDNRANSIGLALVINSRSALVAIAWYKTSDPSGGWVWQPANSPTSGLSWAFVASFTATAVDPNQIATSTSWYYIPQS